MQTDYFLNIIEPVIKGESKQRGKEDQIEMSSWSWGETQSGSAAFGSSSASGRVSMNDFHFNKRMDISSPKLQNLCSTGKFIESAVFTARRTGEQGGKPIDYIRLEFKNMIISSYTVSAAGEELVESISFNFESINMIHRQVVNGVAQGAVGKGYNQKTSRATTFDSEPVSRSGGR